MQYLDTKLYLAEDILAKVDRTSMAVSLRSARALPRPARRRVRGLAAVRLQAARQHVEVHFENSSQSPRSSPAFVTRRGKKGFGVPVAEWLKGRLRPLARDLLSPARLARHGLFDPAYVARLQDEHERGAANHRKLLWTLLVFRALARELHRDAAPHRNVGFCRLAAFSQGGPRHMRTQLLLSLVITISACASIAAQTSTELTAGHAPLLFSSRDTETTRSSREL